MASTVSYPTLQKVIVREGDTAEQIIKGNLGELKGLNEKAVVQFRVSGVSGTQSPQNYTIVLTPSGAYLEKEIKGKPNLSVIVDNATFVSIAKGTYSPFQAYLDGKLRPVGDVGLGKRMIAHLSPPDATAGVGVCPMLVSEVWTYNGGGVGTIAFKGQFFTPSGDVEINFDLGGFSLPPQIVIASPPAGTFTVSQSEVPCGPIPGSPYGIIITATDLTTGKYVTQGYVTPCG